MQMIVVADESVVLIGVGAGGGLMGGDSVIRSVSKNNFKFSSSFVSSLFFFQIFCQLFVPIVPNLLCVVPYLLCVLVLFISSFHH